MDTIALVEWYEQNRRELPWRETSDPYRIWISEVILQQTRVAQGLAYYLRFVERFPDAAALAAADEDEVLLYWQGLGYYSRARNLHAAAKQVVRGFAGVFPTDYAAVRGLKGVGEYTAAAICSCAANGPYAVVDGNVYRVLARLFDLDTPIDSTAGKKQFAALAQELLEDFLSKDPQKRSGIYNQAVMELGALVCTPKSPQCDGCPVAGNCLALKNGTVERRPVKQGKTAQRVRYFNYLELVDEGGNTWIRRRNGKDIWQGLYEFPMIETAEPVDFGGLRETDSFRVLLPEGYTLEKSTAMPKHQLSHQTLYAVFHRLRLAGEPAETEGWQMIRAAELREYAVPRLIELYLEK